MTSKKTLVILAAGLGSRYGGLKQVESFGPTGESLMDYAVFDAVKAGFDDFLLVIKQELVPFVEKRFNSRLYKNLSCDFVLQDINDVPKKVEGRQKPWGTGHAVYACRHKITGPFSVINADDFYGGHSYALLSAFLSDPASAKAFAMVGFRLVNTLSVHGGVSRGVCLLDQGKLSKIEEKVELKKNAAGAIQDKFGQSYSGDEIVSMNCWAFSPLIFKAIEQEIKSLFEQPEADLLSKEIMLPSAVQTALKQGTAVEVFLSESPSFGITFLEDKKVVQQKILELCQKKHYPPVLHGVA